MIVHIPVLLNKTIEYLNPNPNENFVDCTIGEAGHTKAILEKTKPNGKVLGIDRDADAIKSLQSIGLKERLILVHGDFHHLKEIIEQKEFKPINGILFDLGLSSWQIEESGRGFTFKKNEPLLMNFDNQSLTAAEIINQWSREDLEGVFIKYGEERYSRIIARKITEERKKREINKTFQLREIIEKAIPFSRNRRGKINRVLARIFQALRIAVNNELDNLKNGLEQSLEILDSEGRIVVISFNSLEDRIVKNFFRPAADQPWAGRIKTLTKKPVTPDEKELEGNPRSRSAKLRAAIKL